MRLNLGCSGTRYPGFTNVDIVEGNSVDVVGSATRIPVGTCSVDVLFMNAVLEHLFTGQVPLAFAEFQRALKPNGVLVSLGIPDFGEIARLYLSGAAGIVGPRFDLFNVYRYTHGHPEAAVDDHSLWDEWDAARHPDCAPPGYLGQLHKTLYDANVLGQHLSRGGFAYTLFNYCFKSEPYPVNLGFVASKNKWLEELPAERVRSLIGSLVPGAEETIGSIPIVANADPALDLMLTVS